MLPSGNVALIASKASAVMAMRIMRIVAAYFVGLHSRTVRCASVI